MRLLTFIGFGTAIMLWPCLQAQDSKIQGGGTTPELQIQSIGRNAKELEENSLLQSGLANSGGIKANGMKVYKFELLPQETLQVEMKAERNALEMLFLYPTPANRMTPAVRAANQPPRPWRATIIRIKNNTGEPQEAVLMIGGPVNHKYHLKFTYISISGKP